MILSQTMSFLIKVIQRAQMNSANTIKNAIFSKDCICRSYHEKIQETRGRLHKLKNICIPAEL